MSPPLSNLTHPTLHRIFWLQWEDMRQSWVLLYPEGMVTLNDSAAAIPQRCDGAHALGMLIDDLQSTLDVWGIAPEVHAFVRHAFERGWLA